MNIRDRLMSRASVGVMAAFAPKLEGGTDTSKIGQQEKVEDAAGSDADGGDDLGLSAEEQAQFADMQRGRDPADKADIEHDGPASDADAAAGDSEEDEDTGPDPLGLPPGEVAAADAPAPDGAAKPPKTISYGKYQRELQKANKAREEAQALLDGSRAETAKEREQRARLDERTKLLLEAIQGRGKDAPAAPTVPDDPEPDGEQDPIGHLQWQNRKLAKQVETLTTDRAQDQRLSAEQQAEKDVYDAFEADLTREAQADETFAEAFVHLRETRYRELGFIYADIDITDPAQCAQLSLQDQGRLKQNIQRSFHNEQMLVARQALQAGKSPAKVVKNLALSRGFTAKAAAPPAGAAPAAPPAKTNGAAPPPAAPSGSVTDQLKSIRDGQESARSLSDAGGSPGGDITPERVANMSDDEFEELHATLSKSRFDKLLGKPAIQ